MQHALRIATRPCLSVLFVVCALSCGTKSVKTEFSPALVDAQGRPSLGYLEHRGEMYDLRDWSSSVYEPGEKDDAFARLFLSPTIADDGSGFYSVTSISHTFHVEMSTPVVLFEGPFEEPEEDQCLELADIDGPVLGDVRLVIPE